LDEVQTRYDADEDLLRENLLGVRQVVINVQVFAPATGKWEESAWPWIDDLQASFGRTDVQTLFQSAGMARVNSGQARDISALEDSQFNSRVSLDITFLCAFYREDPVGLDYINRVIGSGDLEGNDDPEIDFDVEGP
jgi:hypothetical protein